MNKMLLLLLVMPSNVFATVLLPKDYEKTNRFYKVQKESISYQQRYVFYECTGNIKVNHCNTILSQSGYSTYKLNSLERKEAQMSALILTAEVVTGGIIWKRLMSFTLGKATKIVARKTRWREGVANGTVALAVTAPVNASASYMAVNKLESALDFIDPIERYRRSELVDTDELDTHAIININYGFQDAYRVLDSLLSSIN